MRPLALSGIGQPTGGNQAMLWVAIVGVAALIFWGTIREPTKRKAET